ncbi:MAG: hypothetical protein ACJ8FY_12760 [Gemmataceae bacterium]
MLESYYQAFPADLGRPARDLLTEEQLDEAARRITGVVQRMREYKEV